MQQEEIFYTLALLNANGIGDIIAKKLINNFGSAKNVFDTKSTNLLKIEGIGSQILKNLKDSTIFSEAENELKFIEKEKINFWHFKDEKYPSLLKECVDAPPLLFYSGNIDLESKKLISIVGTRNITNYGCQTTQNIIEEIAPLNPVIISGFAYGVDIVAHQYALQYGLQTIGVLAHGLNQIYPKNHKKYMSKMEENGGFITEFKSNSKPDKENFVKRNRIVAGMCEATVVIESAEKGGSLITAHLANEYNREVFAVPGRTTDKYSQGCNNLIKTQRAHLLSQPADLPYILNWKINKEVILSEKSIQKQLFVELNEEEKLVVEFLTQTGKELMDCIALHCNIPIYKISTLLLNLELKGLVRPLPGKYFETI